MTDTIDIATIDCGRCIDLGREPEAILAALDKDPRLTPYGGANFGMPLDLLEPEGDMIVPTARFFVRSNGPVPVIERDAWSLTVSGTVNRTLTLRYDDLVALPRRTLPAFLECAGNGRTRFDPVPEGTPWSNDAAGCALWEGVLLSEVLALAGPCPEAVDIVAQGADFLGMRRGLPRAVAADPDTLLVFRMNGAPLPVSHGGPVRLLVPGWAGIASTKWLVGLEILDHAFAGFWNADNYVYWSADGAALRPVTEMPVKSVIGTPLAATALPSGRIEIAGYAWSGHGAIVQVEVSVDNGSTWQPSHLERSGRRSWVRFRCPWHATPGVYRLMARATDERGLSQPRAAVWNGKGYAQNGIHTLEVTVHDDQPPASATPEQR